MVSGEKPAKFPKRRALSELDGVNTQNLHVFVDDLEAHYAHAKQHGARIIQELETHDYGEDYWSDRTYECEDIGGHRGWFSQRMTSGPSYS